ncbi:hypothetical protein DB29_03607 [Shouchella clausii]|nr:hypothetical protein DB29_03607 [Shouchella clausii]
MRRSIDPFFNHVASHRIAPQFTQSLYFNKFPFSLVSQKEFLSRKTSVFIKLLLQFTIRFFCFAVNRFLS